VVNLYEYAFNNPLKYVDPMGLSPQDVITIISVYMQLLMEMNRQGLRYPSNGVEAAVINNLMGGISDLTRGRYGRNYDMCLQQSQRVKGGLISAQQFVPRMLDARWRFKTIMIPGTHHYVVVARSSDPNDPVLYLDPLFGMAY
jgi:hypothetical protein